jgi:hypothetical protein
MKSFFERIKLKKNSCDYLEYHIKYNLISDEELRRNIKSYNGDIRELIASKGKCLDILINDDDWGIRCMVAYQGYGLDILVKDIDVDVRIEVAKHGYGLEILKDDDYWRVRQQVVIEGGFLDILVNDKDWRVSDVAKNKLKKMGLYEKIF